MNFQNSYKDFSKVNLNKLKDILNEGLSTLELYSINNEFDYQSDRLGKLFKTIDRVLINKEKGPRLASFIITIGKDKVKELFEKV